MISAIFSLITDGFGMAFASWLKIIVPLMSIETILEMVLLNFLA